MNGREGSFVYGVLTFQTCGEHSMVSLYYYMGKLLIQLALFVVFLLFFGLPSYRRYHEKVYDTMAFLLCLSIFFIAELLCW